MFRHTRRRAYIENYSFSPLLRTKLRKELDDDRQVTLALDGLRAWYLACLDAKGEQLGMPSRVVDVAWHEMILFTREYHAFCDRAFGRYLHHSPDAVAGEPMDVMLARTLYVLDKHPAGAVIAAAGVPLLFAVDSQAGLADGYVWSVAELAAIRARHVAETAAASCRTRAPRAPGRLRRRRRQLRRRGRLRRRRVLRRRRLTRRFRPRPRRRRARRRSNAGAGRESPRSASSPTGWQTTSDSAAACTRRSIRICPGSAASHSSSASRIGAPIAA